MFRRLLLAAAALAVAPLLSSAPVVAQPKELKLFNWSNYMPPDLLKRFEAERDQGDHGQLRFQRIDACQTASRRHRLRPGRAYRADAEDHDPRRHGAEIDAASLPNFKGVGAPFDKPDFDPERAYSVPYMWGTTGIAYDTAIAGGKLEESWKVLFDPPPALVGKVGMLNAPGEAWNSAAHYLGLDRCSEKAEDAQRILDLLTKQKPAVTIYSSNATADRVVAGEVAMQQMWNGAYRRAKARKATLEWIYPKEGLDVWSDNFACRKVRRTSRTRSCS